MTDVQGLPEHHRAYIYARAAVLAEDTSTDALDAMVRRGFTDAEELRMRDRRYLAARGTIIERGEDLAVLDTHAEELLDHHPEGDNPTAGTPQAAAAPSIVEGKEQEAAEQDAHDLAARALATQQTQVPQAVRLAAQFGGRLYGPPPTGEAAPPVPGSG
jgi:hypothetical protein